MNLFTADAEVISKMLKDADLFKVLGGPIESIKKLNHERKFDRSGKSAENYVFEIATLPHEELGPGKTLKVSVAVTRDFMVLSEISFKIDQPVG